MIVDNRKADQPASQSAKKEKILQDDYNTKISPVKEEDYYIQVPISVHNEGNQIYTLMEQRQQIKDLELLQDSIQRQMQSIIVQLVLM